MAKYSPGHWQKILNDPQFKDRLAGRTSVNLKDKYRNMNKARERAFTSILDEDSS